MSMNKGKLIFNGKDGWGYERDGKTYDLLEGMSLGGSTTSCICFVMETDENGYKDFTNWFCCDSLSPTELLKVCDITLLVSQRRKNSLKNSEK